MSGKSDTVEEFLKSFGKSWLAVITDPKEGVVHPAKIDHKKTSSKGGVCFRYMVDKEGSKELSTEIDWTTGRDNLIRDYPDLGMLKVGPTVGYLEVRPYRQWSKGYFPDNATLHVMNQQDVLAARPRLLLSPYSKSVIWQIYNREYWTMKAALEELNKGENVGFPISRDVAVYLHTNIEDPCIAYKKTLMGTVQGNKIKMLHGFGIFREHIERVTKMEAV